MGLLMKATTKLGEDYSELNRYHGTVVSQFGNFISHVMSVVGGVELLITARGVVARLMSRHRATIKHERLSGFATTC